MSHSSRISGEVIPANLLRCMRPEDRPKGVAGMLPHEVRALAVEKAEKELQREIARYLSLLGIPMINPPMHKRSMLPKGWPDFTFAHRGIPVAWECKAVGGALRPDQARLRDQMQAHGWQWRLIRDCGDAKVHLHEIELINK